MIEAGAYYEKISCERTENKNGESHGASNRPIYFCVVAAGFFSK